MIVRFVMLLICLIILPPDMHAEDIPSTQLEWGDSLENVVQKQHITSYTEDDSKSFLSNIPAHIVFTQGLFLGLDSNFFYIFKNNKLIEYSISINDISDMQYNDIKNFLSYSYKLYKGKYFNKVEDRFISNDGNTCILLLKDSKIILYIMDYKYMQKNAIQ